MDKADNQDKEKEDGEREAPPWKPRAFRVNRLLTVAVLTLQHRHRDVF